MEVDFSNSVQFVLSLNSCVSNLNLVFSQIFVLIMRYIFIVPKIILTLRKYYIIIMLYEYYILTLYKYDRTFRCLCNSRTFLCDA